MECLHCKGKMEKKTAPFRADRNGYHISWDAIPAWVCSRCNEPYFEAEQINHIQRTLQQIDTETAGIKSNA